MKPSRSSQFTLILLVLVVATVNSLVGCSVRSGTVRNLVDQSTPQPDRGKAILIFMRPSVYGGIPVGIFEILPDRLAFVGIVEPHTKFAVSTMPGEHLYVVIGGEIKNMMRAQLEPGRTYFALVAAGMGWVAPHFRIEPIRRDQLDGSEFASWERDSEYVEPTGKMDEWRDRQVRELSGKTDQFRTKWAQLRPDVRERFTLRAEDGR